MLKTYSYLVYDSTGAAVGEWPDAPPPSFRAGVDGLDALTVTLNRPFGQHGEPGEAGGDGTLRHGNTVEVWVTSERSLQREIVLGLVGYGSVGAMVVGRGDGLSTLVWRGTIVTVAPTPPAGVAVTCAPLTRRLERTPILGTYTASGDPVRIARALVQTSCPGLIWDSRNPESCGEDVTVALTNLMVREALAKLRDLAGSDWLLFVTARGTVRFFRPDTTATDHYLAVGQHVTEPKFVKDTTDRAKWVIVVYGAGEDTAGAAATDLAAEDPEAVFVRASHLTTFADAERLARLKLAELDRVVLRGECRVLDGAYDLESLEVGQTVQIHAERPAQALSIAMVGYARVGEASVDTPGAGDYDQPIVIAGIGYEFATARLELSQPKPDLGRQLAAFMKETRSALQKV